MSRLDRLLRGAPDPRGARLLLERLLAAGVAVDDLEAEADVAELARIACTLAPYLATLVARDPARLLAAARDPFLRREKPGDVARAELAAATAGARDAADLMAALRAYRAREFVRLGARECGLGDRAEVGLELARLAELSLDAAIAFHDAELRRTIGVPLEHPDGGAPRPARFVVIGMGKLGGEELNFASDIDLLYVYSSDAGGAANRSLHEYFDELARRVTRAIGEATEDDRVFRVDLRLRPEGQRGPLVNSLPSLERYYEAWGRPWERQAWLKARPCAGDRALGDETLAALEPFVFPRATSPTVIRDVKELSRRVLVELGGDRAGRLDVKSGRGGIRQIEFFVQALQLVHAGKAPALRERSTRRALDRLLFAGLVADRERRALADAYDLLRHVEHLLQLEGGAQTQRLPADVEALGVLAGRLGCADAGELVALLERRTGAVAALFETLGAEAGLRPEIQVLVDPGRAPPEVEAALAALGFRDPPAAAFQLELLRRRPLSPIGPSATEAGVRAAPALLEELAASPDPDQALRLTVDLVGRPGAGDGLWRLLEEHRPLLRLLASLFGTSAFLSRLFVDRPELIDALLLAGRGGPRPSRAALARAIDERLAVRGDAARAGGADAGEAAAAGGGDAGEIDDGAAWNALRRVKAEETLRIGLADVAGDLDEVAVCLALSDLADECLARTFDGVRATLARRHGALAPMAVLALGKLGGRELSYASDLDLVFVYDGDLDDRELMTRLAQRLVSALGAHLEEGVLYQVDTRLRPSGQEGTLVSSLAAWRRYHGRDARLWERQALIKARAVAGDRGLGALLEEEAARFVYAGPAPSARELAAEIGAMRARIERELAREDRGTRDLKTGRGGLLDVEFAAQYLQLVHGPAHAGLRGRATLEALEAAARAGVLDETDRATLAGGYRFLRRLEHRMRIVHDRPIHELPSDPAAMDQLARRTGYPSGPGLAAAYGHWTRDVRACYQRLLGPGGRG